MPSAPKLRIAPARESVRLTDVARAAGVSASTASMGTLDITNGAKQVVGVNVGSFRPNLGFDQYFRLFICGRLPIDRPISSRLPLVDAARGSTRRLAAMVCG